MVISIGCIFRHVVHIHLILALFDGSLQMEYLVPADDSFRRLQMTI